MSKSAILCKHCGHSYRNKAADRMTECPRCGKPVGASLKPKEPLDCPGCLRSKLTVFPQGTICEKCGWKPGQPSAQDLANHAARRATEASKDADPSSANVTQVGGSHYQGAIQTWDYIVANNLGYLEGNIIKYVSRYQKKNGLQDLKKAAHYLQKLIEVVEARESDPRQQG